MKLLKSFIFAGTIFLVHPVFAQSGPALIPPGQVPPIGTFWLVTPEANNAYNVIPTPPLPNFNSPPYAVYYLADGIYLVDNTAQTGGLTADEISTASNLVLYYIGQGAPVTKAQTAAPAAPPKTRFSMMASILPGSSAHGNPVFLTGMAATNSGLGNFASFNVAGGTNFVPYDILMSTNLMMPVGSWNWLGIGYTSNNYTFYEQPAEMAFYTLAKPSKTMTVPWGDDTYGQCSTLPLGLTNVIAVSAGLKHSVALRGDGTVLTWGWLHDNGNYVPVNIPDGITAVAAGTAFNDAVLTNGSVITWGRSQDAAVTNVPATATNVVIVSASSFHSLALRGDGTVVGWGDYSLNGELPPPAGLSNIIAIAAGPDHDLAVQSNGTVIAWGTNGWGQCTVPAGLTNAVDVAAGWGFSVALKSDGSVVAWGNNTFGETNVPPDLSNVVAIAAGGDPNSNDRFIYPAAQTAFGMALTKNGTVVTWGDGPVTGQPAGMSNVFAIAGGTFHGIALRTGPRTPVITLEPADQYQVTNGTVTFTSSGTALYGVSYQWQIDGMNISGANNATLTLNNVQSGQTGAYDVVVTDNGGMGSIVSSNASLNLVSGPIILSQSPTPTNQTAIFQTNMTLSVVASAPGESDGFSLSYQWQFNGTNINGATSTNYSFIADTNSPGTYSVTVSNAVGIATAAWQVGLTYSGSYIAPGTLAYYLSTNTAAYASGYSPIISNMLEVANWTSGTYSGTNLALLTNAVWSTSCWLHGVQGLSATCVGYSNGFSGTFLVSMVSPRHYLRASHIGPLSPGTLIAFLDTNNIIYWRTAIQEVQVGSDTDVGILNADLPPSVGYLPVIPADFANYLPTNSYNYVQGIGLHQDLRMFSQPMTFVPPNVGWNSSVAPPFGLGTSWNIAIFSGDSSNPDVFLISNQFVLVAHNTSVTGGPNYAYQIDAINQQMLYLSTNNAVGSDYQLTQYSLTNWPSIH